MVSDLISQSQWLVNEQVIWFPFFWILIFSHENTLNSIRIDNIRWYRIMLSFNVSPVSKFAFHKSSLWFNSLQCFVKQINKFHSCAYPLGKVSCTNILHIRFATSIVIRLFSQIKRHFEVTYTYQYIYIFLHKNGSFLW